MSLPASNWVLEQDVTPLSKKFVLLVLAHHANDDGKCWPTQQTISDEMGMTVRSVCRYMAELEAADLIKREKRYGDNGRRASDIIVLNVHGKNSPLPDTQRIDYPTPSVESYPTPSVHYTTPNVSPIEEPPLRTEKEEPPQEEPPAREKTRTVGTADNDYFLEEERQSKIRKTVLNLDCSDNLAFKGRHLKVTNQLYGELCKIYPDENVMSAIRAADNAFRHRKNTKLSPEEYLDQRLHYADKDLRTAQTAEKVEEDQIVHDPREYRYEEGRHSPANKTWWRTEGVRQMKLGIWNAGFSPMPWEDRTSCPKGVFTAAEVRELKEEFHEANDRRSAARKSDSAAQNRAGKLENGMSAVH